MSLSEIVIKGAREHNLKNISLSIPKYKFIVFTGVSGSGKSSLAFDTLFAEGQRRYVESLSSYARQFLGNLKRPEVDLIEGLSPSIAINQKAISHNPRSTVGTVTEIYDYLRLLFARIGHPHCPKCGRLVSPQTSQQIAKIIIEKATANIGGLNHYRLMIFSPLVRNQAGDFRGLTQNLRRQGFKYIRIDGKIVDLYSDFGIIKSNKHNIDVVVDRISLNTDSLKNIKETTDRLVNSLDQSINLSDGQAIVSQITETSFDFPEFPTNFIDTLYSTHFSCPVCNLSLPPIEPRLFSFNSPQGACLECKGLGQILQVDPAKVPRWKVKYLESKYLTAGSDLVRQEIEKFMIKKDCPGCHGARLNQNALSVEILSENIVDVCRHPIGNIKTWLDSLPEKFKTSIETEVFTPIQKEIASRLEFLLAVGLDYLSLDRQAGTLSSGESQRIRLASQIGTGLTGVLYILDEPTIGLHSRDNDRLIKTLIKLKELGNTLVVVEHDQDVICHADHIVDFGPYAGHQGGQVVGQGTLAQIKKEPRSITGKYLANKSKVSTVHQSVASLAAKPILKISGCRQWNLKNIDASFPLNSFVCITGVSGSGKSTLVHDTLYGGLMKQLYGSYYDHIGQYDQISGHQNIGDLLLVDQSPIGKTPRSNPATYTKVFDDIRNLFSRTTESQIRGFTSGRFSFNVKGGRCEVCQGQGQIKVEMQFLADVYVVCEECAGSRFRSDTLEVTYKDKNIANVLDLTVDEALDFFKNINSLRRRLTTIKEVGLGYLKLGQASNTLSGGESQRLKISRELVKQTNKHTLYILDEPTTGLHFYDIDKLVHVLHRLVEKGNTVVVIEHNLDVIKNADWIIDLGPEGGEKGGYLVAAGSVQDIVNSRHSHTGQYLKKHLGL